MPISTPPKFDTPESDLIESFPNLVGHPFDDIRKMQYRQMAEGWYMESGDWTAKFGRNIAKDASATAWARNTLVNAGFGTDQFSISNVLCDPETGKHTVWVFKIDKSLPNRFAR